MLSHELLQQNASSAQVQSRIAWTSQLPAPPVEQQVPEVHMLSSKPQSTVQARVPAE